MNELKTDIDGGFPVVLDDMRWVTGTTRDAFKAIFEPYNLGANYPIILSGCSRSIANNTVTITEGYVLINGEPLKVDEHSFPYVGSNAEYWDVETTLDANGEKDFQDLQTHQTYLVRRGVVKSAAALPVGYYEYSTTKTYLQHVYGGLPFDAWTPVPMSVDLVYTVQEAVKVYKDLEGFVHIKGYIDGISYPQSGNYHFGQLPVGYRPLESIDFVLRTFDSSYTVYEAVLRIDASSGNIIKLSGTVGDMRYHQFPVFKVD